MSLKKPPSALREEARVREQMAELNVYPSDDDVFNRFYSELSEPARRKLLYLGRVPEYLGMLLDD